MLFATMLNTVGCGGGGAGGGGSPSGPGGSGTTFRAPQTRTDWVYLGYQIDAGADGSAPLQYLVFDAARGQIFVSSPGQNAVLVFDASSHQLKAPIPVAYPQGMDLSADGTTLFVCTGTSLIEFLDPVTLQVRQRVNITGLLHGFGASAPFALNDGRVLLVPGGGVDGSNAFYVWDPAHGTVQNYPVPQVVYGYGATVRTGDRSKVFLCGTSTGSPITIFDVKTGLTSTFPLADGSGIPERVASNPVMDQVAISDLGGRIQIVDSNAHQIAALNFGPNPIGGQRVYGMVFSQDGRRLYLFVDSHIDAYDTATFKIQGIMPEPYSVGEFAQPLPFASDATGMVFALNEDGLDFIDTTPLGNNGLTSVPSGWGFGLGYLTPNTGPLEGGASIASGIGAAVQVTIPGQFDVFLGKRSVSGLKIALPNFTFTVPPGANPGPVPLVLQFSDGSPLLAPAAYSYGPSIVSVITNAGGSAGGGQGMVVGYGLGNDATALQLQIGGQAATVTKIQAPLQAFASGSYPTPAEAAIFTVPPGTVGNADVALSTAAGAATLPAAFRYLSSMVAHPISPHLQAGVYDPKRRQIYYTDAQQILVYSVDRGQWLTPIAVPQAASAKLVGLALSQDGTMLAVGDQGHEAILTLNPDSPATTVHAFSVADTLNPYLVPSGLSVSNQGTVYFLLASGCQSGLLRSLVTSTGVITMVSPKTPICTSPQGRVLLTPDQGTLLVDSSGILQVFRLQAAAWLPAAARPGRRRTWRCLATAHA